MAASPDKVGPVALGPVVGKLVDCPVRQGGHAGHAAPAAAADSAEGQGPPLAEAQGDSSTVLGGNDAWGMPTASATASSIPAIGTNSSSTEVAIGANNDLSIDPFSPMAQKELTDFDLLRNEIEGGAGNGVQV